MLTIKRNDKLIAWWVPVGGLDTKGFDCIEFNSNTSPKAVKDWIAGSGFTERDRKTIWEAYWKTVHGRLAPSIVEEAVWAELEKKC